VIKLFERLFRVAQNIVAAAVSAAEWLKAFGAETQELPLRTAAATTLRFQRCGGDAALAGTGNVFKSIRSPVFSILTTIV
jgi:hypothetical protein